MPINNKVPTTSKLQLMCCTHFSQKWSPNKIVSPLIMFYIYYVCHLTLKSVLNLTEYGGCRAPYMISINFRPKELITRRKDFICIVKN